MATLTEHTMLNGLEENLKSAIEYAGGNIPDNTCVWMYPDIIRTQLTGPGEGTKVNLVAGNGIEINKDINGNIVISAKSSNAENIVVDAIDAPEYSGILNWPEGTILQDLLEDLFYKVIPKIPSIVKGDVIITDASGRDQYAPDLESYVDSLRPNTPYLRIFLVSQVDPIYISMEKLIGIGGNGGYIDLSNYYTISQIDAKFRELRQEIDDLEFDVDLTDYYTKDEVDNKLLNYYNITETSTFVNSRIKEAIDNLDIPEADLENYYTKEETNELLKDSLENIEIQPEDQEKEPITVVEVVEKVIKQEDQITQVEQIVQNQTEQITQVVEQVNNIDQTIIQKVQDESATEEDAINSFISIFENN